MKKFIFILMTVVSLVLSMNARAASSDTFMIVRTASGYYDSYSLRNVEQVYYENKSIEGQVQVQDSFTCTMGGPESMCGSFLSVKNGKNLPYSDLKMTGGKDVEIVFDGTTFVSASLSSITELSTNGCSATIMYLGNNVFGYTTSTGYRGTITVYGELGSKSNCYKMVVTRNSYTSLVEQVYYENKSIEGQVQVQDSFSCTMGGPESMCGSFLSVKNGKNLPHSDLKMTGGKDVEIVFDGTTFVSASLSSITELSTNGCSATIMNLGNNVFGYSTSTGYKGTITVYGELGSRSNCYKMVVTRNSYTSLTLMCVKTADGKVVKYDVENVAEVYYEETAESPSDQGVTVSGKEGIYTYVDLGLPSGTKWATYNVGATKPTEYGDYFAWGETKPKWNYSLNNYKWCEYNGVDKVDDQDFAVYGTDSKYGTVDNKTVLDAEDDAATANWGKEWRMPTAEEIDELIDACNWKLMDNYYGTGIAGRLGTSVYNGATIFLPAAAVDHSIFDLSYTYYGDYWSSSLYERALGLAYCLSLYDDDDIYRRPIERYRGHWVRAVLR